MPSGVNIADLRAHLVISGSKVASDDLLKSYIAAAEVLVKNFTRLSFDDSARFPDGWPEDVNQAVRLLSAHYFYERAPENQSEAKIPPMVAAILEPYRDFSN